MEQYGRPSGVLGEPLRHIVDLPVQNDPAVLELFVLSDFLAREARKLRRRRDHLGDRHSRNRKGTLQRKEVKKSDQILLKYTRKHGEGSAKVTVKGEGQVGAMEDKLFICCIRALIFCPLQEIKPGCINHDCKYAMNEFTEDPPLSES